MKIAARVLATVALIVALSATSASAAPKPSPRPEHVTLGGSHAMLPTDQLPVPSSLKTASTAQTTNTSAGVAPFLTRPYWNPHSINSVFDHTNPTYNADGKVVEYDGTTALKSNGVDPYFSLGYAVTPGGTNYLYYDGHNGWDLGLNYENVIAAAPGTVQIAGNDPNNSGFGLTITIDHGDGFTTRYAHLSQVLVGSGQVVSRGQLIGVSGNTGNSTGPHLHFGVYITSSWTAIDPWGWTASFADPWPSDQINLWFTGNPQNPVPGAPTGPTATAVDSTATVSWSPPSFDGGSPITAYKVTASPGGASVTVGGSATSATLQGLGYGIAYTFTVTASNAIGSGPASSASNSVTPVPAAFSTVVNWYDTSTPGMTADNLHIANPGTSPATALVSLWGSVIRRVELSPGQETVVGLGSNVLAGPLLLQATSRLVVSQRVQYFQSFNELNAAATPSMTSYLSWYDRASTGMLADNIHISNPGGSTATGTVTVGSQSQPFSAGPAGEAVVNFPAGTIGGPVVITASQPVVASQRVEYYNSFSEMYAQPASAAATTLRFSWYDRYSRGMSADNIHIVNQGSGAAGGTVLVGNQSRSFSMAAGQEAVVSFPAGTLAGPVVISATQPVLASERIQYYQSFDEIPATATAGSTTSYFNWFDQASPGMWGDNIHVVNPGTGTVSVTVSMAGASRTLSIPPGQEGIASFGAGAIGGPITVSASGPVLACQRVQYYESFSEVLAAPG